MKKLFYFLSVFTIMYISNFAQNVDIPDPIFKNYLLGIPELNTNNDQEISNNEAYQWSLNEIVMNVSNMGITSLKGMEAFRRIRKIDCSHNFIKKLDFSSSEFSNQIDSLISNHNLIDSIIYPSYYFRIKYMDLSYNQLNKFTLKNNFYELILSHNQIKSIESIKYDLTGKLDLSFNSLTSLDVSNLVYLTELDVSNNQLKSLKLPYKLSAVSCYNNSLASVCVEDINEALKYGKKDASTEWYDCYKIGQKKCYGANLSSTGACDDFMIAPNSGTDEYLIETDKPRWNGVAEPNEKAYMGLFWSETIDKNGFTAKKTRVGDGILRYMINQPDHFFEPIIVSFGSYAVGNLEKKFTLDLSKNSNLEFIVKNKGIHEINILVSLQDINGNDLVFQNYHDMDSLDPDYHYQIGNNFNGGVNSEWWTNYSDAMYTYKYHNVSKGVSKFSFDFSNAVCGKMIYNEYYEKMIMAPCPNVKFDYSNVGMVKIIVTRLYNETRKNDLVDYPIEIYNFKLGNSTLSEIADTKQIKESNLYYEVFDILGHKVAEGKESELHLKHGQIYIFKSQNEAFKRFIFK